MAEIRIKSLDGMSYLRTVSEKTADALQRLADRGEHGVHIGTLGGIDFLGEMSALGVAFRVDAHEERGTMKNRCWVVVLCKIEVLAEAAA